MVERTKTKRCGKQALPLCLKFQHLGAWGERVCKFKDSLGYIDLNNNGKTEIHISLMFWGT